MTPATLIGVLTILGYSLYDTVVVFDKIRENTTDLTNTRFTYSEAANTALNQVLVRSINTTIIGVLPVAALLFTGWFILGTGPLKDLGLALFVGMIAGAYSSIFIATPLLAQMREADPDMVEHRERLARRAARGARDERPRGQEGGHRGRRWTLRHDGRPANLGLVAAKELEAEAPTQRSRADPQPDGRSDHATSEREPGADRVPDPRHPGLPQAGRACSRTSPRCWPRRPAIAAAITELAASAPGAASTWWSAWRRAASSSPARWRSSSAPASSRSASPASCPATCTPRRSRWSTAHETLAVHTDAILPGARVLVVDDVLATGGTVGATAALVDRLGAELVHVSVLMELSFLGGRAAPGQRRHRRYLSAVLTV